MSNKEMGVVAALAKIEEDLFKASGYPNNTTQDGTLAFAYGLVIGAVMQLRQTWKERLK